MEVDMQYVLYSPRHPALRMRPRRRAAHHHDALPDGQRQLLPVLDWLGHWDCDGSCVPAVSDCGSLGGGGVSLGCGMCGM